MTKYRKKPAAIEAVKYTGKNNVNDILNFIGERKLAYLDGETLNIETLEGVMKADVGDYIIKGIKGESYPCKPDIFEATYENGEITPKTLLETIQKSVETEDIEAIVYVTKDKNGVIVTGWSVNDLTSVVGMLECGKRLVLDDMYD